VIVAQRFRKGAAIPPMTRSHRDVSTGLAMTPT
jgi:hypothetical protein